MSSDNLWHILHGNTPRLMELAAAAVVVHMPMLMAEGTEDTAAEAVAEQLCIPRHPALTAALAAAIRAQWSAVAVAATGQPGAAVITLQQWQLVGGSGRQRITAGARAVLDEAATRVATAAGIRLDRATASGLQAVDELQAELMRQWSGGFLAWRVRLRAEAWSRQRLRPILRGNTYGEGMAMQADGYAELQDLAEAELQAEVHDEMRATQLGALLGGDGRDALERYAVACAMRTAMRGAHLAVQDMADEHGLRRWQAAVLASKRAWQEHLSTWAHAW